MHLTKFTITILFTTITEVTSIHSLSYTRFPPFMTGMFELYIIAIITTTNHKTDGLKTIFIIIKSERNKTKLDDKPIITIITIYIIDADIINHMLFIIIKCFGFFICFLLISLDESIK